MELEVEKEGVHGALSVLHAIRKFADATNLLVGIGVAGAQTAIRVMELASGLHEPSTPRCAFVFQHDSDHRETSDVCICASTSALTMSQMLQSHASGLEDSPWL